MNNDEIPIERSSESLESKKKEKKTKNQKRRVINKWVFIVLAITLLLSFAFSLASQIVLKNTGLAVAYVTIVLLIIISIIFDVIGVAATSCDIEPFLSMSARKVKGAKMAVSLAKNANKVSSVCADIIGDICGIVSGACGTAIVIIQFANATGFMEILIGVIFTAVISTLTITGKAISKTYAINNANKVIFTVAKILSVFKKS